MHFKAFSLNGTWEMDYTETVYNDTSCPAFDGTPIESAVPGYFEDMADKFRIAPFYSKIRVNPSFGMHKYPITHYCPDLALPNLYGNFFYKRSFVCEGVHSACCIHFYGVQNAVSLWLNGEFLGRHEGYSTSFDIDIPAGLIKDGENTVVLSVSNLDILGYGDQPVSGLTNRAACEYTGGIMGDVELRMYTSPLRDAAVLISEDLTTAEVRLDIDEPCEFSWAVSDGDTVIVSGCGKGDFSFDVSSLEKWSPESPKLYTLTVTIGDSVIERHFGVRRLTTDGSKMILNGEPVYLRGVCEHCYYPETVHPTTDPKFYRDVIRKLKKLGFNFIRFHTHIPAEEYMQAADELGMLLHVESPNYTSLTEWYEIVNFCRRHTSVVIYCCGNELQMDEDFIAHIGECADAVHVATDGLFSPMSALRGLEYFFQAEPELKGELVSEPMEHNPRRFSLVSEFSDLYSSFSLSQLSYKSHTADPALIDSWHPVYNKPRITHEICIHGTYADLSLTERYKDLRIGKTGLFSSVEEHLRDKGLISKAPLYHKNSSEWQRRLRKHCFESARLCETLAGYDFLGPIDTHWHTFGYDCGMMNEFYELKPGETVRNVLMYNSPAVLLTDLGTKAVFTEGEELSVGILTSNYAKTDFKGAELSIRLTMGGKLIASEKMNVDAPRGCITRLCDFKVTLPHVTRGEEMKLYVTLDGGDIFCENEWELYCFPKVGTTDNTDGITVSKGMTADELTSALTRGEDVLLLGGEPFKTLPTTFRIALAGRPAGNLATVIDDHKLFRDFPHEGFAGLQFFSMLEGGSAVSFECEGVPFEPIFEVVSTHKCAVKQAAVFEFSAINGRLLVCTLNMSETDPAARYLKSRLISYMKSRDFAPRHHLDAPALSRLIDAVPMKAAENTNAAFNPNDKAATRR